jgi:hypothetical protein
MNTKKGGGLLRNNSIAGLNPQDTTTLAIALRETAYS